MRFVVIGAGMAGVLSGIRLRQAGYEDWIVYEKGDSVGGTWRENTYPGLSCDVPSHIYSYAFEPNPDWSQRFSPGAEIRRYFEGVADKYGILPRIRFNEEVERLEFRKGRWHLTLKSGKRDEADVVIAATGVLHHPMIPEIPGLGSFAGACFHSARWDHSVPTDGKRVGVIGTGSTAIQITSALVPSVAKFSLFQRTPQWIAPQENAAYTEAEKASFREDPIAFRKLADGLAKAFHESFSNGVVDANSEQMKNLEAACRENLEKSVKDPVLREKLRPNYRAACKRLIMSGDFYDAIQQPNAELVTEGIERIEPGGVRTKDGKLHELDVLVLATGFRVDRFLRPMKVIGRDGVDLEDAWKDRPKAYLSISIPGFPNLWSIYGPNTNGGLGPGAFHELVTRYALECMERLILDDKKEIEAKEDAYRRYNQVVDEGNARKVWSDPRAHNYYWTEYGRSAVMCPFRPSEIWRMLRHPDFEDLIVR